MELEELVKLRKHIQKKYKKQKDKDKDVEEGLKMLSKLIKEKRENDKSN